MICPICGHDVPTGGHFCPGCGTDLLPYTLDAETGGSFFLPETDLDATQPVIREPFVQPEPNVPTTPVFAEEPVLQEMEQAKSDPQPVASSKREKPWWLNLVIAAIAAVLVIVIEIAAVMHFSAFAEPSSVDDPVYTETMPDLGFGSGEAA